MTIRAIPSAPGERLQARSSRVPLSAAERFQHKPQAAVLDGERTIHVYGYIGEDWDWTEDGRDMYMSGTTSQQISQYLRALGPGQVTLNINSPGGDMFEGLAIYNLLRAHQGEVVINVVGVAASAASIITMAGDTITMGPAAFLMIHNTWTTFSGNRLDFVKMADAMLPFDQAMAAIYASRSGLTPDEAMALMDAETWISAEDALAKGFADSIRDGDQVSEVPVPQARLRAQVSPKSPEADQLSDSAVLALQLAMANINLNL